MIICDACKKPNRITSVDIYVKPQDNIFNTCSLKRDLCKECCKQLGDVIIDFFNKIK